LSFALSIFVTGVRFGGKIDSPSVTLLRRAGWCDGILDWMLEMMSRRSHPFPGGAENELF
jgi:hypothetical protein